MSISRQIKKIVDKRFTKVFQKITEPRAMKEVGQFAADQIRLRTRLSKGVEQDDGPENKLLPLAESTKKARKKKKKKGKLSSKTTVTRSNLTETGEMLDSISVIRASKEEALIGFSGDRNKKLGAIHNDLGAGRKKVKRPFFHISKKDRTKIRNKIRNRLRQLIKK